MQFIDNVRRYYFDNFADLSPDKQFHFASRLYSWNQDSQAHGKLGALQSFLLPSNDSNTIREQITLLKNQDLHSQKIAKELREPFFNTYPT